jgi:hypothetical protein
MATRLTKPYDLMVSNGFVMEFTAPAAGIGVTALSSASGFLGVAVPANFNPKFESVSGIQSSMEHVETVDAGTNRKFRAVSQLEDSGELTLMRTEDGTGDDLVLMALVEACKKGLKLDAVLTKFHHGVEQRVYVIEGFAFKGVVHPTYDVMSGEKYQFTYNAIIDRIYLRQLRGF